MNKNEKISKNSPIGFFDSGFGGMSIVREFARALPNEEIIYIADGKHFPYGSKDPELIKNYSIDICEKLVSMGVKLIIVACGTATSAALDTLKEYFEIPVFGIIKSTSRAAVNLTMNNKIGVLATEATINLGLFEKTILNYNKNIEVINIASQELVKIAEENIANTKEIINKDLDINTILNETKGLIIEKNIQTVKDVCIPFLARQIDTLILGCTHFPLLLPIINIVFRDSICAIEPGRALVKYTNVFLKKNNLLAEGNRKYNDFLKTARFYTTGVEIIKFKNVSQYIFSANIDNFSTIQI